MNALERAGYLAYGRLSVHQRRLNHAHDVIRGALAVASRPYVAFSAGKDSAVLLWLVLQTRSDVIARILTSGESRVVHANLDQVLGWWRDRFPTLTMDEVLVDRVFADGWQDASFDQQRKAGKGDIVRELTGGFDLVFMGLRDEESKAREIANRRGELRRYTQHRRDGAAGMYVCCPLSKWTTDDIGAEIVAHDLPLLTAYSQDEGLEARTTMRLTGDAVRMNAVVNMRLRDPAAYNRMLQRFPELAHWGA